MTNKKIRSIFSFNTMGDAEKYYRSEGLMDEFEIVKEHAKELHEQDKKRRKK